MSTLPIFEQSQSMDRATLSTANPGAYDGSGATTVGTGTAAPGKYYTFIRVAAIGDTAPGMIRIFTYDGSTTVFLFAIPVPENVADVVINGRLNPPWNSGDIPVNIPLKTASWELRASSETGDTFKITAPFKDFNA